MRALVIGGTRFVGAAIVDALLEVGAEVTVFSRGKTNAESLPAGVSHVRGDRASQIELLGDRRFDAVFDTCGYRPDAVEASVEHLAARTGRYVFMSTASVYAELESVGEETVGEGHPLAAIVKSAPSESGQNYGPLKVLCERAVIDRFADRATVLRPSLIVGPRDYTDRFPYWPVRLSKGGAVLVPGDGEDPAQILDARDLGQFAVALVASDTGGVFNVTGPAGSRTFADLIEACGSGVDCQLHWAPATYLDEHGVSPWKDMPCWLGREHSDAAILRLDIGRAVEAGLTHRSWRETAADTLAWFQTTGRQMPLRAGLSAEREAELIAGFPRWDEP